MRSVKLVAVVALLAGSVAFGASQIVYTLELGGNDHADLWEAGQAPSFTQGATTDITTPLVNDGSLTWAVRVSVGGRHNGTSQGNPGGGAIPLGAANLVFDLELYDNAGSLVDIGAAPMALTSGQNQPTAAGYWSMINDGDAAGARGSLGADILANAAFAIGLSNTTDPMLEADPARQWMVIDPKNDPDVPANPAGPNFDYGWYPTANGRGGIDIDGTKAADTTINNPALKGKLVGFGAGYKSYNGAEYAPGVGVGYIDQDENYNSVYGFGRFTDRLGTFDPFAIPSTVKERVVFEGQICTKGLAAGTYTLKVVPSADGSNILHGAVDYVSPTPSYGGWGSFAAKADEVYPLATNNPGVKFVVQAPILPPSTSIVSRKLFYNQSAWDGNRLTIDAAPTAGDRNDDGDAIDPTKSPLMIGGGKSAFVNYTGYSKGINGLIYDIKGATRAPVAADFTFRYLGRSGTMAAVIKTPLDLKVWPAAGANASDRVVITFPNFVNGTEQNSIGAGWVEVEIGTGFGLPAAQGQNYAERHYWGNAPGETGNSATDMLVNATDVSAIKAHFTGGSPPCPVEWQWNINKDGLTNATDVSYVKTKFTGGTTVVIPITK